MAGGVWRRKCGRRHGENNQDSGEARAQAGSSPLCAAPRSGVQVAEACYTRWHFLLATSNALPRSDMESGLGYPGRPGARRCRRCVSYRIAAILSYPGRPGARRCCHRRRCSLQLQRRQAAKRITQGGRRSAADPRRLHCTRARAPRARSADGMGAAAQADRGTLAARPLRACSNALARKTRVKLPTEIRAHGTTAKTLHFKP